MNKHKRCPIDGDRMESLFVRKVLGRYPATYFMCPECGLIQTEDPYWLEEAYSSPISALDTWGATRNFLNVRRLSPILCALFRPQDSFVDAACGYGLLVRSMRDIGFDFHGHDKFSPNLFSRCLPPLRQHTPAAVTCFEVLEHLVDPVAFIGELLDNYSTDSVIASTTVFSGKAPDVSWPYYSFESGQHVSLYQVSTLKAIAGKLELLYASLGEDLHLFTRKRFSPLTLRLLRQRRVRSILGILCNVSRAGRSFTLSDYEYARRLVLEGKKQAKTTEAG